MLEFIREFVWQSLFLFLILFKLTNRSINSNVTW